jgi:hypothetical protein
MPSGSAQRAVVLFSGALLLVFLVMYLAPVTGPSPAQPLLAPPGATVATPAKAGLPPRAPHGIGGAGDAAPNRELGGGTPRWRPARCGAASALPATNDELCAELRANGSAGAKLATPATTERCAWWEAGR